MIPNAQKNAMEPILIELKPEGRTKRILLMKEEEFGYVMKGSIFIHIGSEKHKVRKGESFYYKANSNHYISNGGKTKASVLWVSTPPSF